MGRRPEQDVMIYGASGGVGLYAVQLAKAAGAFVTGVCSTRNTGLAKSAGCDKVVDSTGDCGCSHQISAVYL